MSSAADIGELSTVHVDHCQPHFERAGASPAPGPASEPCQAGKQGAVVAYYGSCCGLLRLIAANARRDCCLPAGVGAA